MYSRERNRGNKAIQTLGKSIGNQVEVILLQGNAVKGVLDSFCISISTPFIVVDDGMRIFIIPMCNIVKISLEYQREDIDA
jgi:hypothetical protein